MTTTTTTKTHMCHNYMHASYILNILCPTSLWQKHSTESPPIASYKVGEYRAWYLRTFFFTESLRIIQGPRPSLVHSPL